MKKKVMRDQIHGDIDVSDMTVQDILKHNLFQRLRYIAQTGFAYLVYPSMRHSRFEHSLGAYYLAIVFIQSLCERIKNGQFSFLDLSFENIPTNIKTQDSIELMKNMIVTEQSSLRWEKIFTIAALLHDIGHGPFSHGFELVGLIDHISLKESTYNDSKINAYLHSKDKIDHEDISIAYIDDILYGASNFDSDDIRYVAALVNKNFREFLWLDEGKNQDASKNVKTSILLSPMISGLIDVDRLDYIARDSALAGVSYGVVEVERLLEVITPVLIQDVGMLRGGIVTNQKYVHTIDHFIFSLYQMYTHIYLHPAKIRLEKEFKELLRLDIDNLKKIINFSWHKNATDNELMAALDPLIKSEADKVFSRQSKDNKKVALLRISPSKGEEHDLKSNGWQKLNDETPQREMVKNEDDLFLCTTTEKNTTIFSRWKEKSVLSKITDERYRPSIWWKNELFNQRLSDVKNGLSDKRKAG